MTVDDRHGPQGHQDALACNRTVPVRLEAHQEQISLVCHGGDDVRARSAAERALSVREQADTAVRRTEAAEVNPRG